MEKNSGNVKVQYDLHTHGWTNWKTGKYCLERTPREPKFILDAVRNANLDGIVLANFGSEGDWIDAYERFSVLARDKEKLGSYKLVKEIENALLFADENGLISVIKGEEFPVILPSGRSSHLMAIGLNKNKVIQSNQELTKALMEIKNMGAISDADHYNGAHGMHENNLRLHSDLIDVFEGNNQNYSHRILKPIMGMNPTPEKADKLSREIGVPWISVSDCHNLNDYGTGRIELYETLDFSNADNLRNSLREILKERKFSPSVDTKMPVWSVLEHMFLLLYETRIRNPLGWINLENP